MISARTPHKLFRALFHHMFTMVSLYRVKFVRVNVMLLLLPFPGEVTAWLRCGGKIFVKPVWTNRFRSQQWKSEQDGCIMYKHARARTHAHTFNGPLSGTTRVSRYQKGKTNLDFTEARDSKWQWHQLGNMQVCISLLTDNHASTPPLSFFAGRMPFLPPNHHRQSTEGKYNVQ